MTLSSLRLAVKVFRPELNDDPKLLPKVATEGSAGLDLRVFLPEDRDTVIKAGEVLKVPTGIGIELPNKMMMAIVVPRSSSEFSLQNTIGIIDSDYRGEIFVKIKNASNRDLPINHLRAYFQLIVVPVYSIGAIHIVNKFETETERGEGGDGSTTEVINNA